MNIELNKTETKMLRSAINAKIKRCRGSINNNGRNPTDKSEAQIVVRQHQIDGYNQLLQKLEAYEPAEAI